MSSVLWIDGICLGELAWRGGSGVNKPGQRTFTNRVQRRWNRVSVPKEVTCAILELRACANKLNQAEVMHREHEGPAIGEGFLFHHGNKVTRFARVGTCAYEAVRQSRAQLPTALLDAINVAATNGYDYSIVSVGGRHGIATRGKTSKPHETATIYVAVEQCNTRASQSHTSLPHLVYGYDDAQLVRAAHEMAG